MIRKSSRLQELYFQWLCGLVGVSDRTGKPYWLVLEQMHNKEFDWSVPNDDNRACEGRNLRERFCDENDIDYDPFDFPEEVSVLEVVIALAYRCESIVADQEFEKSMKDWFWKLMENISLNKFADNSYDSHVVDYILDIFINRTYDRRGRGGLFPLKYAKKDQRKVELWYQMNTYLVENYYSDDAVI